jgi:hypothetical protein
VDPERVELSLLLCGSSVFPLDDEPNERISATSRSGLPRCALVELEGVAPSSPACRAGVLLLNYNPEETAPPTGFEPVIS